MMTTLTMPLFLTAILAAYSIIGAASGSYVKMKKGKNFIMECNTMDIKTDSFSIHARQPKKNVVVFYDHYTKNYTAGTGYDKRVHISGAMHKLTIKISDLQLHDSGLYLGTYSKFDVEKNAEEEKEACSALLFVNEDVDKVSNPAMSEPLVLVLALTTCTMVVVCFLVMWALTPKVKALCVNQADDASREYSPVYEDMHRVQNK